MIGQTVSHYTILDKLGEGGMGVVYLAADSKLGRKVALKVLPSELAANPDRLERFRREAKALAALDHPNIVTIHTVEEVDDLHFLTMQLVEGRPLSELIPSGGLPLERIFEIAVPLADALAAAHEKGVIHRDLKPANVMVAEEAVKVLDFGLAKLARPSATREATALVTETLTQEGHILGTVRYMSPEQLEGRELDAGSDIFSLGVILYEMATGTRPFSGDTPATITSSILRDAPLDVDQVRGDLPHHLGRIIRRCLEKKPKRRFQSAMDVRNELEDLRLEIASAERSSGNALPPPPVGPESTVPGGDSRRPGRALLTGAAVILAVIVAVGLLSLRGSGEAGAEGGRPVVILMDTPAPTGVYDENTRRESGTNADDLSDALGDLPVVLHKETVGVTWDREDQILNQHPDLIVIHRSCFAHSIVAEFGLGDEAVDEVAETADHEGDAPSESRLDLLKEVGVDKLRAFLGYVGLGDPDTRFLVYSRGHGEAWSRAEHRRDWVADLDRRFPALQGRLFTIDVPVGPRGASFRDPATSAIVRDQVTSILGLEEARVQPQSTIDNAAQDLE